MTMGMGETPPHQPAPVSPTGLLMKRCTSSFGAFFCSPISRLELIYLQVQNEEIRWRLIEEQHKNREIDFNCEDFFVPVTTTMKVQAPIPEEQQREIFQWMLEEKRKLKPKNPLEKKQIDEEKAILKHFLRAKSIPKF